MTTAFQAAIVLAAAEGGKQTVAVAGSGAARFAAREVARGALWEIGSSAIEWLFSQFGWDWDPDGPDPYPPTVGGSCGNPWKFECPVGNYPSKFYKQTMLGISNISPTFVPQYKEITGFSESDQGNDNWMLSIYYIDVNGNPQAYAWPYQRQSAGDATQCVWASEPSACSGSDPQPSDPVTPPSEYITSGDCVYKVGLESLVLQENGQPQGVLYKVEADDREERSGPITNCNIAPTYVFEDGTGEGPVFIDPIGPDGEALDIDEIVRRINNPIIEEINNNTDERIEQYFDERVPVIAGGTWDLQGVCEKDAEGAIIDPQPTTEWTYEGGSAAVVANYQLMLMQEMLQQQLDWRHLTCGGSKPELQGDWVSTGWMSLEASENSNRPLRKLFRYRSLGDRDVIALLGYWKDFQWEAGPVCVIHKGAWWGLPQVWAASEEEGKRVIRFAGVNAGIDPDTEGTWIVSASAGGRYGRTGTMTLACHKGQYHVSARDDADWPTMQPGEIYES